MEKLIKIHILEGSRVRYSVVMRPFYDDYYLYVPTAQIKYAKKISDFLKSFLRISRKKDAFIGHSDKEGFLEKIFTQSPVFEYLSNIPKTEREEIIKYLSKFSNSQLKMFVHVLQYNSQYGKDHNIILDLERIKGGLFNKKILAFKEADACSYTYEGFLEALRNKSFNYATLEVNGKLIPVLIKSKATSSIAPGKLALDPKTLDVYAFTVNPKSGKINNVILKKMDSDYLFHVVSGQGVITKNQFKKNIVELISQKYSKENLNKIKENMKRIVAEKRKVHPAPKPRTVRV